MDAKEVVGKRRSVTTIVRMPQHMIIVSCLFPNTRTYEKVNVTWHHGRNQLQIIVIVVKVTSGLGDSSHPTWKQAMMSSAKLVDDPEYTAEPE